jgi:hypothetical protein
VDAPAPGDAQSGALPGDLLEAKKADLAAAYNRARPVNMPLDALFVAIDEVMPVDRALEVRAFALGELDSQYGAGSGYRCTMPLVTSFDVVTGYAPAWEDRAAESSSMKIVELAEAIATDPLLTNCFLWSMHHGQDDDASALAADCHEHRCQCTDSPNQDWTEDKDRPGACSSAYPRQEGSSGPE